MSDIPYKSIRVGDQLVAGKSLTCLNAGQIVAVHDDENAGSLYVTCQRGRHFLDGGKYIVGFTLCLTGGN